MQNTPVSTYLIAELSDKYSGAITSKASHTSSHIMYVTGSRSIRWCDVMDIPQFWSKCFRRSTHPDGWNRFRRSLTGGIVLSDCAGSWIRRNRPEMYVTEEVH